MPEGRIKVQCFYGDSYVPVDKCRVTIRKSSIQGNEKDYVSVETDSSGLTNEIPVEAPLLEYSMNPSDNLPYSLYDLNIEREGFEEVVIKGVQVYPDRTALQNVNLINRDNNRSSRSDVIIILPNTLCGS